MSSIMGVIFIIVATVFLFPYYGYAFDDGDFQYWSTGSVSYKVHDNWKIVVEEELRFGDDAGDFYYQHTQGGVVYSGFADWIDVGINYRQIFEEKKDDWKYENRPQGDVVFKFAKDNLMVSDRNRIAYRDIEDGNDRWHYRNKLTVKLPLKVTRFECQPYVADEVYIDFDEGKFNRNRLYAGIAMQLTKHVKGEVYYLWQTSESNDDWIDLNIIGTKVKLSF